MLFVAEFHFGPRGGGPMVAARWQHGPTPGVKVLGAWVSTISWGNTPDPGLEAGRTNIVFEADTPEQVGAFTNYLHLVCTRIEIRPVFDYLPFMRAFEARDPEQYPQFPLGITPEARRRQLDLFRQYTSAPNAAEPCASGKSSPARRRPWQRPGPRSDREGRCRSVRTSTPCPSSGLNWCKMHLDTPERHT